MNRYTFKSGSIILVFEAIAEAVAWIKLEVHLWRNRRKPAQRKIHQFELYKEMNKQEK